MRRRALLASLAGLAAGCQTPTSGPGVPTATPSDTEDTSTTPTPTLTPTPTCTGDETPTPVDGEFRITDLSSSQRSDRRTPIQLQAEIVDAMVSSGDPGVIELALVNVGETTQKVFSGTVPPFGMVFADLTGCGERFLLWRDYTSEGCIKHVDGRWLVCDIGVYTTLNPGDRVARRYEVLPVNTSTYPDYTVPPGLGRYSFDEALPYHANEDEPESTLRATVHFVLEASMG